MKVFLPISENIPFLVIYNPLGSGQKSPIGRKLSSGIWPVSPFQVEGISYSLKFLGFSLKGGCVM